MDKREKVIKGLREFKVDLKPFAGNKADWQKVDDALELLKVQEAVEPVFERQFLSSIEIYDCGKCGTSVGAKGIAKYCMNCGQAVKWDV